MAKRESSTGRSSITKDPGVAGMAIPKATPSRTAPRQLGELPDGCSGNSTDQAPKPRSVVGGEPGDIGDEFRTNALRANGGFDGSGRPRPGMFLPRWSDLAGQSEADRRRTCCQRVVCLGWHPDIPDPRDLSLKQALSKVDRELRKRVEKSDGPLKARAQLTAMPHASTTLPRWVDLRPSGWLPTVEDQGPIGSCTAQSVVGVLETLACSVRAEWTDLSRLFLYKVTRNVLQWTGDTGAYIRSTIKAATLFGVPPEELLPYDVIKYEQEPSAFLYQYATSFKANTYARLDTVDSSAPATPGAQALENIKSVLARGYTVAFGFPVFSSIQSPRHYLGEVPYPRADQDRQIGGHAVQAIGYNDDLILEGPDGRDTPGGIVFRNSWGTEWGDAGFGYLPYAYFEESLAVDCWTIFNAAWVDEKLFG